MSESEKSLKSEASFIGRLYWNKAHLMLTAKYQSNNLTPRMVKQLIKLTWQIAKTTHRVEQDVGGFEVPVDDRLLGFMEEGQPFGSANGDLQPC